jgi:multicomponent Na+:H+ antiporter subunit D
VLTLIAGSRLWAHMFWRSAPEGAVIASTPIRQGDWLRFGATGALVVAVVAAGLWPNGLFEAVRLGAPDLLDPARYVAAIALAGGTP